MVISSIIEGIDQETELDIRFYDHKEPNTLSNKDSGVFSKWQLSNHTEFGQSKKRVLDSRKIGKENQLKLQKNTITALIMKPKLRFNNQLISLLTCA